MLRIFTLIADWIVYDLLAISANTKLGDALHFFIEDTTKIFALLFAMIYVLALVRASLNVEFVRDYLSRKNRIVGYLLGAFFGAVTPFCSCSSIPIFLGFTSAAIPLGVTMSFLLTSPIINEVAVLLLLSLVGWKLTLVYVLIGLLVGILGGVFLDLIGAERWLQPFAAKAYQEAAAEPRNSSGDEAGPKRLSWDERREFAKNETKEIFGVVWKWIFIGIGLGAALHGYVPDGWIESHLSGTDWWSVPAAVLLGIPLYSNATGVIPVMESLIGKGLPIGTTLAFCMSTVAASFPEFILLKQVLQWRLLALIFVQLLVSFSIAGWALNLVQHFL